MVLKSRPKTGQVLGRKKFALSGTVNERWGRTFALLTGDFLFSKVYSLMAPHKDLNKILAEATVALVEGETLQAAAAREKALNRELYQQIVAKKTPTPDTSKPPTPK